MLLPDGRLAFFTFNGEAVTTGFARKELGCRFGQQFYNQNPVLWFLCTCEKCWLPITDPDYMLPPGKDITLVALPPNHQDAVGLKSMTDNLITLHKKESAAVVTKQQPKEPAGPPPGYKVKEVQQPAGPPPGWTESARRPTAPTGPPPKKMPKGRGRGRGKSVPPSEKETREPMLRPKTPTRCTKQIRLPRRVTLRPRCLLVMVPRWTSQRTLVRPRFMWR